VSDFVKVLIVRMGFFNQKQKMRRAFAILSGCISQDLLKITYEILMFP